MQSLAEDNRHFTIGVILSGGDSDGVIGMEYIKGSGGLTYAQDSKTAKFFDMPRNAINSGVIDFILSPEAISRELNRLGSNISATGKGFDKIDESFNLGEKQLQNIFALLKEFNNIDFSH